MIEYELFEPCQNHFMKILKCSSSDTESQAPTSKKRTIVLLPGNPGVIELYEQFAIDLNKLTGYDILGLSHTDHVYADNMKEHCSPVNVINQVNDKVKFIENYLKKASSEPVLDLNGNILEDHEAEQEIYFIGHSFGCYLTLEILALLNKNVKQRVKHAFLLFPTVERMMETPNGKWLNIGTMYGTQLFYLMAYLVTFLPKFIQKSMFYLFFFGRNSELQDNIGEVLANICSSFSAIISCFQLGRSELDLNELNKDSINQSYEFLTFYYGQTDNWAPIEFYDNMKDYIEDLYKKNKKEMFFKPVKMDECEPPIEHAFNIYQEQTNKVSKQIARWIKDQDNSKLILRPSDKSKGETTSPSLMFLSQIYSFFSS